MMSETGPLQQYREEGFYIHPGSAIPADVVHRAVEGMDEVRAGRYDTGIPPQPSPWNPGDDPAVLCKIEMPQIASRKIMELVSHSALGQLAAAVAGARMVQVWWVQLLYKPPTLGASAAVNVGWHQDRQYWGVWEEGSELFTAWVALSDVTADSGPMRFVRRSHRWGLVEGGDFFGQDLEGLRGKLSIPMGERWEEAPAILPPGGVSLHHCLTLHASGPNRSTEPRRSFAIHLRTEKSRPVGDERTGLAAFIDDPAFCPVVFGSL